MFGIRSGDLVAIPSLTFSATAQAIVTLGGIPVFVDIDPLTWVITPDTLAPVLYTPGLRGVIAVHLFGNMAPVYDIKKICQNRSLFLIEDAAQSLGSTLQIPSHESAGRVAAFSFDARKQLPIGQGGMLVFSGTDQEANIRSLRHCGLQLVNGGWLAVRPGTNHLMSALGAALGRSILKRIDAWNVARRRVKSELDQAMEGNDVIACQQVTPGCQQVPHRWAIMFNDPALPDAVLKKAKEAHVPFQRLYAPLHMHPFFADSPKAGPLTHTECFHERHLCLDISPFEVERQIQECLNVLEEVL